MAVDSYHVLQYAIIESARRMSYMSVDLRRIKSIEKDTSNPVQIPPYYTNHYRVKRLLSDFWVKDAPIRSTSAPLAYPQNLYSH
jgi:hypothetical protein